MRSSRLRSAARGFVLLMLLRGQVGAQSPRADTLPLPEHPRPDFQRAEWLNLNGRWQFALEAWVDNDPSFINSDPEIVRTVRNEGYILYIDPQSLHAE